MSALEVAVTRKIGDFELDTSFTVDSGISVLFGPSGAGKSLTLSLIAGLIRPDQPRVRLLGKGTLTARISITVAGASKGAVAQVEQAGGSVTVS